MIKQTESHIHWNYFLALESDLERQARFIEFTEKNYSTFSIELARLLQAACSEVDVLARELCEYLDPAVKADNIHQYRRILKPSIPELESAIVQIPRYGLSMTPWVKWKKDETPIWWADHNKVKHRRNEHFNKANLKNTLNATAGLLLLVVCYYGIKKQVSGFHQPPQLFRLDKSFATHALTGGEGIGYRIRMQRSINH